MRSQRVLRGSILWMTLAGLGLLLVLPAVATAQEEVTTSIRRYKDRETSTGYYEDSEVKPYLSRSFLGVPGVVRPPFAYSPEVPEIPHTYLADSHRAIQFYNVQTCVACHAEEAKDIHTTRGNITCRQCHGGEPIASIAHYFSPLNPVRRYAYLCSKCHEGSSASFATYVVHEPNPGALETRKTFASLFYSEWFMSLLIVGTLGFFGVHTAVWVSKELYHALTEKKRKPEDE